MLPYCKFAEFIRTNTQHIQSHYPFDNLLLLLEDLLVVEVVFFIFEDVAISTATLTRTRRDASKKLTGSQLFDDFLLLGDVLLSLFKLGDHGLALSLHLAKVIKDDFALTDNLAGVVLFEPGLEGRSIDGNNTALHDGVGTHEFVVGSVVDNVQDLGLGGESYLLHAQRKIPIPTFTGPGESTAVQTNGTVLDVTATAANEVNSLTTELGHGRLTAHFELSLLNVDNDLSTSKASLMTRITANTYTHD